jgi:hypothetical protein
MLAPQVAAVGENQSANEGHGLLEQVMANDEFQTVQQGSHADFFFPARSFIKAG